jgi:hypothetical protein
VDRTDTDVVIARIERRFEKTGYNPRRRPEEPEPTVASWDVPRREVEV